MKLDSSSSRQLQQIYAQFPALKSNADKGALEAAATKVLGTAEAKALLATLADPDTYLSARAQALSALVLSPSLPAPVTATFGDAALVEELLVEELLAEELPVRSLLELRPALDDTPLPGFAEWLLGKRSLEQLLASVSEALPPIGRPSAT